MVSAPFNRGDRIRPGFRLAIAVLILVTAAAAGQGRGEEALPVIVTVVVSPRLRVGEPGEVRIAYRAPQANIVAVLQALDDLDGPSARLASREREVGVVARAFGYETGELVLPLAFATLGWKRVTLTLVTDERELSDPAVVELEVLP